MNFENAYNEIIVILSICITRISVCKNSFMRNSTLRSHWENIIPATTPISFHKKPLVRGGSLILAGVGVKVPVVPDSLSSMKWRESLVSRVDWKTFFQNIWWNFRPLLFLHVKILVLLEHCRTYIQPPIVHNAHRLNGECFSILSWFEIATLKQTEHLKANMANSANNF